MRNALFAGGLLAAAMACPLYAQAPAIQADQAWARATPATAKTAAVYLRLTDQGAPDTVTGVTTPVAGMAMVHETINDNGVMRMRMVDGPRLETGKPVTFRPGGLHIMLEQLKHPLKLGDTFPVTLTFAQSPPVTVTVTVGKPGSGAAPASAPTPATSPTDNGMGGMKMNSKNGE